MQIIPPSLYAGAYYFFYWLIDTAYNECRQLNRPMISPEYLQGSLVPLITGVAKSSVEELINFPSSYSSRDIAFLSDEFKTHNGYNLRKFIAKYGMDNTKKAMEAIISGKDIAALLPNPIRLEYKGIPDPYGVYIASVMFFAMIYSISNDSFSFYNMNSWISYITNTYQKGVTILKVTYCKNIVETYNEHSLAACEAGIPADQASKFTNSFQTEALKVKASVDDSLKINNKHALAAYKTGKITADQASQFSNYFEVVKRVNVNYTLKIIHETLLINNQYALFAYKKGIPFDQASKFSNSYQTEALKVEGTSVDDALKINNEYALASYKTGKVSADEASQFSNPLQVEVLKNGLVIDGYDRSKTNDSVIGTNKKSQFGTSLKVKSLKISPLKVGSVFDSLKTPDSEVIIVNQKLKAVTPQKEVSSLDSFKGKDSAIILVGDYDPSKVNDSDVIILSANQKLKAVTPQKEVSSLDSFKGKDSAIILVGDYDPSKVNDSDVIILSANKKSKAVTPQKEVSSLDSFKGKDSAIILVGDYDPSKVNDSDVIILSANKKSKAVTPQKEASSFAPLKILNAYIVIDDQKLKIMPQEEASVFDLIVGANQESNFDNPDQVMSGMNDIVIYT